MESVNRRTAGAIVDLRIRLTQPAGDIVMTVVQRALRRHDAVLSYEGREVSVALANTTAWAVRRTVIPRVRDLLEREGFRHVFVLEGTVV